MDPCRKTLYCLELEQGSFRHTIPVAVTRVIVKQQKDEWEEEFWGEKKAYDRLKELRGTVIPQLFGQGSFNGLLALIHSEVVGTTLYDLARSSKCKVQEETSETQLEDVFKALSEYGAVYWDQKLDSFLFCDNGDCENSKMMIVDLEQVQFPEKIRPWEISVNRRGAISLMRDFRDIRHPNRESSPVRFRMTGSNYHDDESALGTVGSTSSTRLINRGNTETPNYVVA